MKKRNWIIGSVAVVIVFCLVACTKIPVRDQVSIIPLPEHQQAAATPSALTCDIQFPANDGTQRVDLSVETWREGRLIAKQPLMEVDHGGTYSIYARMDTETELIWGVDSISADLVSNEACLTTDGTSEFLFSVLTANTAKKLPQNAVAEGGIVLLCLAFGDLESGIPAIDCMTLTQDETFFSRYQEVQLVRGEIPGV
ncbi:hypothetical protein [Evtepia sp.]|uniref:hypothetical protein n=1 Tax=Evtepia sp. TaxID=2773933 RepID=UPI003F1637E3